jgi:adenylate cyclase
MSSHDHDASLARDILLGSARGLRFGRRFFRTLPADPRCKLCASPFGGVGGVAMRAIGKGPWPKNPKYCSACWRELNRHRDGAEIECSLVFADVRGSTALAERMRPAEFRALMNRFFDAASDVLVEHDGIVDKFVGDEVIGIFVPGLAGPEHAKKAIHGARGVLAAAAGHAVQLPVGAGVHTDIAFVGTVGDGALVEFTAMGDAVNTTARLASVAGAGECLVTVVATRAAGIDPVGLEHRRLDLKGKDEPIDVVVLHA